MLCRAARSLLYARILVVSVCLLLPLAAYLVADELPAERWLVGHQDRSSFEIGAIGAALLVLDVVLPVPSSIVGSLLVKEIGAVAGFSVTWIALVSGSVLGWSLGRASLARFDPQLPHGPTALLVAATRSVPVIAEAGAIAAGASRMRLVSFVLASAAGNALYASTLTLSGALMAKPGWAVAALAIPIGVPVASTMAWRLFARQRKQRKLGCR